MCVASLFRAKVLPYVVDYVGVLWGSTRSGGGCGVCVVLSGLVFVLVCVVVVSGIGSLQPPCLLSTKGIHEANALVDTIVYL